MKLPLSKATSSTEKEERTADKEVQEAIREQEALNRVLTCGASQHNAAQWSH